MRIRYTSARVACEAAYLTMGSSPPTTTTTTTTSTTTSTTTTTRPQPPTVSTASATSVGTYGATLNGTVNPNGSDTQTYFQYGKSFDYGSRTSSTAIGPERTDVWVSTRVTGLESGVVYHFRIVGKNSAGTGLGMDQRFKTAFLSVSFVNPNDDTCGGNRPCYTSIQQAIDATDTGKTIRIAGGTCTEALELNESKALTLSGQWNNAFTDQTGDLTILNALKAPKGSLTLQNIKIVPPERF